MDMETETQGRGRLTSRIKEKSKELLGYEISRDELSLMAHFQYVMVNDQRIDHRKVNDTDREILMRWQKMDYVHAVTESGKRVRRGVVKITKEFWDIICEIIFLGYVDID